MSSKYPKVATKVMGTLSPRFIRDAIELQNKTFVLQRCVLQWCTVGYGTQQISSEKRETLESDRFCWQV